jgi:DNA-binding GntR family transcriptional regulator
MADLTKRPQRGSEGGEGAGYEPRAEEIARRLREAIHEGRLEPGQRVRQEAVANEYGVSRLPVREALRRLETEGLVVIMPHSGARVASLNFAECEEIYKIRERLEPLALAESIRHSTEGQIERAFALLEELERHRDDPTGYIDADRRLHLVCYEGVPTSRLLDMIVGFWNTTQQYRRVLVSTFTEQDFEVQKAEHSLIVDTLASGNAFAGEELMRVHIERSRLRLARRVDLFGD